MAAIAPTGIREPHVRLPTLAIPQISFVPIVVLLLGLPGAVDVIVRMDITALLAILLAIAQLVQMETNVQTVDLQLELLEAVAVSVLMDTVAATV